MCIRGFRLKYLDWVLKSISLYSWQLYVKLNSCVSNNHFDSKLIPLTIRAFIFFHMNAWLVSIFGYYFHMSVSLIKYLVFGKNLMMLMWARQKGGTWMSKKLYRRQWPNQLKDSTIVESFHVEWAEFGNQNPSDLAQRLHTCLLRQDRKFWKFLDP